MIHPSCRRGRLALGHLVQGFTRRLHILSCIDGVFCPVLAVDPLQAGAAAETLVETLLARHQDHLGHVPLRKGLRETRIDDLAHAGHVFIGSRLGEVDHGVIDRHHVLGVLVVVDMYAVVELVGAGAVARHLGAGRRETVARGQAVAVVGSGVIGVIPVQIERA